MSQPIYEIPVTGGLNDSKPVPPPGFPPSAPQGYGPPPVVDAPVGAPPAPGSAVPPVPPTLASAPPPSGFPPPAPPSPAAAAPDLSAFPPPAAPIPHEATRASSKSGADQDLMAALQEVLMSGASDLHVTVNAPPMIRVDGALRPIASNVVWERHKVTSALYSIMSEEQREVFERELELDFAFTLSANARFRVNFYQQRNAIGGAFRLIPTEIKQLADLGIPDAVSTFATLPRGLVLVTGPTGSGKSTTLAALIDLVNRTRSDHIMTVEDPIEFLHSNQKSLINQREVGHDTHSFSNALKHVLRQDPDVILIGELRDLETISTALTAAETGHLVFATLHTQDAPQTVDRIIDVFPPHQQEQVRAQLAATLQGVVCQTLVKHASGTGRVVAAEVMVTTPAIANLIREGQTYQLASAMQAGRQHGMQTMDQHLAELVNLGLITHRAALTKVHDAETFSRLVHRQESTGTPAAFASDFGAGLEGR
ncbi:type IV pilus twitching motility protein PilT [Antiquaquibacter soli]|uniref:Type IV pilus twitching motility protein PilT n=1 Tax=Antiquaquibacter soli TaxID=3064523 RepID=A0ABT9BPB4_9MICO|nr:type IV pilus twitching motility protein PilT [Protaetiibacter sp. WY-16]MDO7882845.1 type IV pilus twitching motility protein PilT [Protaetiibacter sp. WY-16]